MLVSSKNDARLDFRLPRQLKELIEEAACLQGQSLTDFAISTLAEKSRSVVQHQRETVLSRRDQELFLNLLENPPEPNEALRKAVERYRQSHG